MIAVATYVCTGAERIDGSDTIIPANISSGQTVTNLFVNGAGRTATSYHVSMGSGLIRVTGLLQRGSHVKWLYKTLPRYSTAAVIPAMVDYESSGYESADYE